MNSHAIAAKAEHYIQAVGTTAYILLYLIYLSKSSNPESTLGL